MHEANEIDEMSAEKVCFYKCVWKFVRMYGLGDIGEGVCMLPRSRIRLNAYSLNTVGFYVPCIDNLIYTMNSFMVRVRHLLQKKRTGILFPPKFDS